MKTILTALGFLAMVGLVGCGGGSPRGSPDPVDGGGTDPDGMAPLVADTGVTSTTDAGTPLVTTDAGGINEGPGTLALSWTVDGQAPSTGCPAGSVVVDL